MSRKAASRKIWSNGSRSSTGPTAAARSAEAGETGGCGYRSRLLVVQGAHGRKLAKLPKVRRTRVNHRAGPACRTTCMRQMPGERLDRAELNRPFPTHVQFCVGT